ncbi:MULTISPECIES: zinc-binding dehydrogenase [unclassified Thiomonas]|uniref:Zinc-binding dehydrogenase n=2 Tax=Thiomonas arsenitoxydans (strain DSM 22701 / CIP 110005 / 3As) TaxID=426114 RepID=A0A8I1SVT9_THIA3|nr:MULTISPECIES: zinc-binding dehydrogenase [unclassified Thiomonas]MBN8744682.1 zinc-binding dehydrogenase [Thiomonas arsenitoxydans]CQR44850.1 putative oxidoreductase [Thiomonas sp. CB3]CDW92623.1 Alcohol dehydrogenase zinc-binding domain protein [Thiomonas sp. CB2]VDY05673.1 putative oxidoreductase [Thiomonas sp. Bio17B3]VDY07163.1 putative oxidoreductase [Thiomonas sp. Sup16B3]
MTEMMKAWVPDPGATAHIRLTEVAKPELAADEVLIRVAAYSVNRGETFLLEAPTPSWRPGKDVSGRVAAVGSDVQGFELGQRVVAHPDQAGWAEWVAVKADRVVALPDGLDDVTAAAIPLAGLTALRLTRATGPLAARRVLLTGASGGVGHAFVQLAAAQGARVTTIAANDERGHRLRELGAVETIPSIEEVTGLFDIALESTGGAALAAAWEHLVADGRLVWFGQASRSPATLDFFNWKGGMSATLRKFYYLDDPSPVGVDLESLVRLVAQQRLHIEVGLTVDWRETPVAIETLLGRRVRGNVVLRVEH